MSEKTRGAAVRVVDGEETRDKAGKRRAGVVRLRRKLAIKCKCARDALSGAAVAIGRPMPTRTGARGR